MERGGEKAHCSERIGGGSCLLAGDCARWCSRCSHFGLIGVCMMQYDLEIGYQKGVPVSKLM